MTSALQRRSLRRQLRHERRRLSRSAQRQHALAAARHFLTSPWPLRARVFGIYAAADGELDLQPLIQRLAAMGKILALPVIDSRTRRMDFYRYRPGDYTVRNRYGIAEPALDSRPVARLDAVLTPLVAFDQAGHRLGMGGGYYDRFAHRQPCPLIGCAHELQRVDALPAEPWDVPLTGAITEAGYYRFR